MTLCKKIKDNYFHAALYEGYSTTKRYSTKDQESPFQQLKKQSTHKMRQLLSCMQLQAHIADWIPRWKICYSITSILKSINF